MADAILGLFGSMKRCAQCQKSFSDTTQVCPDDGSFLIDANLGRRGETSGNADVKVERRTLSSNAEDSPGSFNVDSIIGQTIDGKYHVEDFLGLGGMGAVFRARHTFINNEVAIKIIHPRLEMSNEIVERFLREARAAAMIDHPNAIKVTDFGRTGGMLYLVMEFIQGYNLADLIRKEGYLSPTVTAEIMTQVCAALDAAHKRQIIHRDLKPENIMIKFDDGQRIIKVLDFGLAKIKRTESNDNSLTGAGVILGTLNYMSPEQCRGNEVIDLRSDIYSLGVVTFEMLTGKLPFDAPTPTGVVTKHVLDPPPSLRSFVPDIPEEVERVVLRTMEKKPAARYQSAGEFAAELTRAAQSTSILLEPLSTPDLINENGSAKSISGLRVSEVGTGFSDLAHEVSLPAAQPMTYEIKTGLGEVKTDRIERVSTAPLNSPEQDLKTGEHPAPFPPPRSRAPFYAGLAIALLALALGGGYFALRVINEKGPAPPGSQTAAAELPGMVLIHGGWMKMGNPDGYEYEQPVHDVWVDSFYMDVTEVTNKQFERFADATGYLTDAEKAGNLRRSWRAYATPDRSNHPVVSISWNDAAAYAKWVGKRLPTEAEWEYAARGGLVGKKYPWGDDPPQRHSNFGHGGKVDLPPTQPVKSYEANGYGLYDMAGNVSEWCQDWYDQAYYRNSPERSPQGPSTGQARVIRGGSWYTDHNQICVAARISESPGGYEHDRGFRCAKSR